MAAPGIAATAILLREYFLSHYAKYCRFEYTDCRSFTPSGGLDSKEGRHPLISLRLSPESSLDPRHYLCPKVSPHLPSLPLIASPPSRYSSPEFDLKTRIKSYSLSDAPDSLQGYGAVKLSDYFPLPGDSFSHRDLYVRDALLVYQGVQKLILRVKENYPLKITIVSSLPTPPSPTPLFSGMV
jgi:hypothetical protein